MTFFISLFVLFMQFLWKWFEDFIGKGLDFWTMAEMVFYICLTLVPMALPLAILLSSLMTFGNFGEHYELVALKSSGLSLQKIMRPLTFFVLFLCAVAFIFANMVLPYANLKMWSVVQGTANTKAAINLKEGAFYSGINGYVIKVEKKENDGALMKGITIYDHTQGMGNTRVTNAEEGFMQMSGDKKFLVLTLRNGSSYDEVINNQTNLSHPLLRSSFQEQTIRMDLRGFELKKMDEEMLRTNYEMLDLSQIASELDSVKKEKKEEDHFFEQRLRTKYFTSAKPVKSPLVRNPEVGMPGLPVPVVTPANVTLIQKDSREYKLKIISTALTKARAAKEDVEQYLEDQDNFYKPEINLKIVWHQKFTLSFACLVLFFIGAPLGAIIRRGGLGMPVVVSILLFILYYVLSISGEKFAKESILSPFLGTWLSSFVLLPLGVFLTYKATADSSLFDIESYLSVFKRIFMRSK